jgi:hypothetical protein
MITNRKIIGTLVLLAAHFCVWAQGVTETVGQTGLVNWSSQIVQSTGIGAANPNLPPTAQRAGAILSAKLDALRNLLGTVQGVSLTSETTVRNFMLENDVINTRVRGIVRGYTVVDTKYMSSGDIEVVIEVPLTGVLSDAVLPSFMGQNVTSAYSTAAPSTQTNSAYTGLIIDARGLGVRPAMAPKILDENDEEIYGSRYVSREWAVKIGMVGYDKDAVQAKNNDRVTNNPMVVKAIKVSGPNKADVVVSNDSAQAIRDAAKAQNFLDKCKVMFIVD